MWWGFAAPEGVAVVAEIVGDSGGTGAADVAAALGARTCVNKGGRGVNKGRWALGAGRWALGAGRWALGAGRWALGAGRSKCVQREVA